MSKDKQGNEIDDIDCMEAINGMYAYLDGEMTDTDELARFEHHLEHCRSCYARRGYEEELIQRIREATTKKMPEQMKNTLRNLIDKL